MSFRSQLKKQLDESVWSNPQKADVAATQPVEGAHPATKIDGVCGCGECIQFSVETEPMRRVPTDDGGSRLIHGRELRAYLDTTANTMATMRARLGRADVRGVSRVEIHGGEE